MHKRPFFCGPAAGFLLLLMLKSTAVFAQQTRSSEISLFVEPLAVGSQLLLGRSFAVGAAVSGGPMTGIDLSDTELRDTDALAAAQLVVALGSPRVRLLLSPIGAALLNGGDFSAVYPSGQVGLDIARGRWRFGTHLRVIRIAGTNNTADYWAAWLPLRIGYTLSK